MGFCDGTVIVHDDRSSTCSNDVCTMTASNEAIVAFHGRFVPCASSARSTVEGTDRMGDGRLMLWTPRYRIELRDGG